MSPCYHAGPSAHCLPPLIHHHGNELRETTSLSLIMSVSNVEGVLRCTVQCIYQVRVRLASKLATGLQAIGLCFALHGCAWQLWLMSTLFSVDLILCSCEGVWLEIEKESKTAKPCRFNSVNKTSLC